MKTLFLAFFSLFAIHAAFASSKLVVLVVDDEANMRDIINDVLDLEFEGQFQAIFAKNGFEGLDQLAKAQASSEPVSVIYTDLIMPRMNGDEFIRKVKELYPGNHFYTIMASGDETFKEKAKKLGVDAFLKKPFQLNEIVSQFKLAHALHQKAKAPSHRLFKGFEIEGTGQEVLIFQTSGTDGSDQYEILVGDAHSGFDRFQVTNMQLMKELTMSTADGITVTMPSHSDPHAHPSLTRDHEYFTLAPLAEKNISYPAKIRKPKIALCVDDLDYLRDLHSAMLRHLGFRVITAENGADALKKLEVAQASSEPVDIVVTDRQMPVMSGDKLAPEVKRRYGLPVVMVSGSAEELEGREAELGLVAILAKPVQQHELARHCRQAFEKH